MLAASQGKTIRYLLFFILLFAALYYAKAFLIPLAFGALFATLLLPIQERLEPKTGKMLAISICVLGLVLLAAGIIALVTWQVAGLSADISKLEQQISNTYTYATREIGNTLGLPPEKQQQMFQMEKSSFNVVGQLMTAMGSLVGILGNIVLVIVYIFLLMYSRSRIKNFILQLVPKTEQAEASEIIDRARKVAQKYLSGLAMMIVCLWILYSIGFSIVGIRNPIFFAILCGLLEIVPFVGNLTGSALTALMALAQGGGVPMMIGVLVTYSCVQTFQSYVLAPLVVGSNVNINPLFTILILVVGELLWGIAGMILSIPLLGVVKIVCDHVKSLQPYGYLIGDDRKTRSGQWLEKLKKMFGKQTG
jgi:predicted PurR-regulated permease PerM